MPLEGNAWYSPFIIRVCLFAAGETEISFPPYFHMPQLKHFVEPSTFIVSASLLPQSGHGWCIAAATGSAISLVSVYCTTGICVCRTNPHMTFYFFAKLYCGVLEHKPNV